jgi:multisubunit Na+/H+ antiporter MnhG subunit
MLEKCRILYKGDMIAASFYLFVGMILLLFACILYFFTLSLGYKFLSYGFFMFFLYSVGKGAVMYYIYSEKYKFYLKKTAMDRKAQATEIQYTEYRIAKKNTNRRRYIWTLIISSVIAFLGIFSPSKAILMGTAIPIALISGIELAVGMLTEFRLREFLRILNKPLTHDH